MRQLCLLLLCTVAAPAPVIAAGAERPDEKPYRAVYSATDENTLPLNAQDSARWLLRAGVHPVQPKPDSNARLRVRDGAAVSFAATRMVTPHWGIETFATLPVAHDVVERDSGKVAGIRHVPIALSVQYHLLDPNGRIRAYVGAGLNYTRFFGASTTGAWAGADLDLDSSFGATVQVGIDLAIGRAWFVSIDGRWFDIDTHASVNNVALDTIELDPYAFGLSFGRRLP